MNKQHELLMDFFKVKAPLIKTMADFQQQDTGYKTHRKIRVKKDSTHIDMTPMVDLAFLLLTFFMLTTTFMKLKTMDITMPVKGPPTPIPVSQTISILLTEGNRIFWYDGVDDPANPPKTNLADFSLNSQNSIRKILLEKNKLVLAKVQAVKDSVVNGMIRNDQVEIKKHIDAVTHSEKKGLIVLIKPDDKSKYKNLVDMLDEILICQVATYAIVDVSANELELIKNAR